MTHRGRTTPLCLIGRSYVLEACPTITTPNLLQMESIIHRFLAGSLDPETASQESEALIGTRHPINKLTTILTVADEPLQPALPVRIPGLKMQSQKKSKLWSGCEDARLLAGIHRFGLSAWGSIANFVGNNRTKAQCCQRWCRGLDPRISKTPWTAPEDEKLRNLVQRFGQKQWTRIAREFGNRCDVQCRYRFTQLQNAHFSGTPEEASAESSVARPPKTQLPPIHNLIAQANSTCLQDAEPSPNDLGLTCVIGDSPQYSS
jgi:hypothetical protein